MKRRYTFTAPVASLVVARADHVATVNVAFVVSPADAAQIENEVPPADTLVMGSVTLDYELD